MTRWTFTAVAAAAALLLGALPGFSDRLRAGVAFEYGSASGAFGLSSPNFTVPYQNNTSSDAIFSGNVEYLVTPTRLLDLGIAFKGSFALSAWNLGSPGVTDYQGYYWYPDNVHISADWWALALMGTAHLHMGRFVTLDGAIGYGPYGYVNVNYWDDAGVVSGPVAQDNTFFPADAWGVDWSAGLSFGFFRLVSLALDVGMMGPDFVGGLGVNFTM